MSFAVLVAANMREAEHYRHDLMEEIHQPGEACSVIELVTPRNAHRKLLGLRPRVEVYVMSCAMRDCTMREADQLRHALNWLERMDVTVIPRLCGKLR